MITINQANAIVSKLWGAQAVDTSCSYRIMKYVLKTEYDGKIALLNNVTSEIVILDEDEKEAMQALPSAYLKCMDSLIQHHFLVPSGSDEWKQVSKIRYVLYRSAEKKRYGKINKYVILPTTACNARCYYCFEHGIQKHSMTQQTAADVIDYIDRNCGEGRKVTIQWFGGEPTVGSDRITQICQGLIGKNIEYESTMITNGYLFDQKMVDTAADVWKVKAVQIAVDGTENNYNKIKAYVNAKGSAYQRLMDNVDLLTGKGIHVTLRMNIDLGNYQDFVGVLNDLDKRFPEHRDLTVYAFPLVGEYTDRDGRLVHADEQWMSEKVVELNTISLNRGYRKQSLDIPYIDCSPCWAGDDTSIVIGPMGTLSRCCERVEDEEIVGTIYTGIIKTDYYNSWRKIADSERCIECAFYPQCTKLQNCNAKDACIHYNRNYQYEVSFNKVVKEHIEGERSNHEI